ncbi:Lysophosphatidylcholine acyltransferase 2 [Galemys pyrenaicus]|uniref:Lysophosphatidylcholine acyltransferase 2 n=1 Tax=Galemys pyrenaicus TaxID=202257 RepID=A0A8J6DH86_GALPY|nr:Lysophosphatidylcholine acyltransferase 2 [Galemys pyrenaicus]
MNRCAEAAAVAATVPGAGVGKPGLRPPMVPRQASFFPPPVPNPFVQQSRMGAARRAQVRGVGLAGEAVLVLNPKLVLKTDHVQAPTGPSQVQTGTHTVTVKGKMANSVEAPIFVVAPHSSFFDGIACVVTGLPSIVSRNENVQVPLIGRAFIPGVPVQPVLLRYPNKLDTVTWTWQGYTFIQLCMLTFCQPFTKVEVERRCSGSRGAHSSLKITSGEPRGACGACGGTGCLGDDSRHHFQGSFQSRLQGQGFKGSLTESTFVFQFMPVQVPNDEEKGDPVLFASRVRNLMAE